jgi:hypothetical protein
VGNFVGLMELKIEGAERATREPVSEMWTLLEVCNDNDDRERKGTRR